MWKDHAQNHVAQRR